MPLLDPLRSVFLAATLFAAVGTPPSLQAQAPLVPRRPMPQIEAPPRVDFEEPMREPEFYEPPPSGLRRTETPALFQSKKADILPQDNEEMRLMKERYNAGIEEVTGFYQLYQNGVASMEVVCDAALRAGKAKLELTTDRQARRKAYEELIEVARMVEEGTKIRMESGTGGRSEYHRAVYFRADVELQALRDQRSQSTSTAVTPTVICMPRTRRFGR